MKKLFILLVLLSSIITSPAQLTKEQQAIKKVFVDFQHFYLQNEKKFNSFKLYKGKAPDNGPPYHIAWKEVERYFSWLRKNVPFVGEEYINNERREFRRIDSVFKVDTLSEIAQGFDYDRWAGGQEEAAYMVKSNVSPKNKYTVTITGNRAVLKIGSPYSSEKEKTEYYYSTVPMIREKGRWVMAGNMEGVTE